MYIGVILDKRNLKIKRLKECMEVVLSTEQIVFDTNKNMVLTYTFHTFLIFVLIF